MKTVARVELRPGMTLGEDVIWQDKVIFGAGTVLSQLQIDRLKRYSVTLVTVMEDVDFATTHYEKLRFSQTFRTFELMHAQSLMAYKGLMHDFNNKVAPVPDQELLYIYNEMRATYTNCTQLLDYLYNLMPNEDELTYNHCLNSALLVGFLAEWMDMPKDDQMDLILSGFYYDIGKLHLPYELLWSSEKLTPEEYTLVKNHPTIGWDMLKGTHISQDILDAVLMHHERMDGSGYPQQLQGDKISIFARYLAIVDTYIAMASPRPHRDALTPLEIIETLDQDKHKYDTDLLTPFIKHIADAQVGASVKLNDESVWDILTINPNRFSRPILSNRAQEVLDLMEHPELEIVKMV